jgi:hypothetical protein
VSARMTIKNIRNGLGPRMQALPRRSGVSKVYAYPSASASGWVSGREKGRVTVVPPCRATWSC